MGILNHMADGDFENDEYPETKMEIPLSQMTLRDYFAGIVLNAMDLNYYMNHTGFMNEDIAIKAYIMADAMIKARSK